MAHNERPLCWAQDVNAKGISGIQKYVSNTATCHLPARNASAGVQPMKTAINSFPRVPLSALQHVLFQFFVH